VLAPVERQAAPQRREALQVRSYFRDQRVHSAERRQETVRATAAKRGLRELNPSASGRSDVSEMAEARTMLARAERRMLPLPARGVELALLDWGGSGPLALLHHATGFCKGVWAPVAEALRPHFRVIALDARGHVDSSQLAGAEAYAWAEFAQDLVAATEALVGSTARSRSVSATRSAARRCSAPARRGRAVRTALAGGPRRAAAGECSRRTRAQGRAHSRKAPAAGADWDSRAEARAKWGRRSVFAAWRPEVLDLYALDGLRERADGSVTLKCASSVEAAIFEQGGELDILEIAEAHPIPTLWLRAARGNFPGDWCRSLTSSEGLRAGRSTPGTSS
jgi:pimeloyl-ACP methyl ester carboxylesterase